MCVCVCVCEREREREIGRVCIYIYVCVCIYAYMLDCFDKTTKRVQEQTPTRIVPQICNGATHADEWVMCDSCKGWEHQACAGFLGEMEIPEEYICNDCTTQRLAQVCACVCLFENVLCVCVCVIFVWKMY